MVKNTGNFTKYIARARLRRKDGLAHGPQRDMARVAVLPGRWLLPRGLAYWKRHRLDSCPPSATRQQSARP